MVGSSEQEQEVRNQKQKVTQLELHSIPYQAKCNPEILMYPYLILF